MEQRIIFISLSPANCDEFQLDAPSGAAQPLPVSRFLGWVSI